MFQPNFFQPNFNNCVPIPSQQVRLESGEIHCYTFRVTQVEKRGRSYQFQPNSTYLCHLTDKRLILEPEFATSPLDQATSTQEQPLLQISYTDLQAFKLVRSWTLKAYAQICCNPSSGNGLHGITLAVASASLGGGKPDRAADFVALGNSLLGIDNPNAGMIMPKLDPAALARFQTQISGDRFTLVYFSAPGCQPCQVFSPIIDEVIAQYGDRLDLVKVDVEQGVSIAMSYGVDCFPSILLFQSGQKLDQIVGVIPKPILIKVLNKYLSLVAQSH